MENTGKKKCPLCAQEINAEALVCPWCHAEFVDPAAVRREKNKLAWTIIAALAGVGLLGWLISYLAYKP
jgi:predicted nucleic acid-binding Zn ribbon protein